MARISGVNIPSNKHVEISLTYIYGIGRKLAQDICKTANVDKNTTVQDLTPEEIMTIRQIIDKDYVVEGTLRRNISLNIKRLMDLGCYRGLRHRKHLPVRGQRTHTNARTRRGRSVPIAGKRIAGKK